MITSKWTSWASGSVLPMSHGCLWGIGAPVMPSCPLFPRLPEISSAGRWGNQRRCGLLFSGPRCTSHKRIHLWAWCSGGLGRLCSWDGLQIHMRLQVWYSHVQPLIILYYRLGLNIFPTFELKQREKADKSRCRSSGHKWRLAWPLSHFANFTRFYAGNWEMSIASETDLHLFSVMFQTTPNFVYPIFILWSILTKCEHLCYYRIGHELYILLHVHHIYICHSCDEKFYSA